MRIRIATTLSHSTPMSPPRWRAWWAACVLAVSLLASASAQTLINVNVGPGMKVGQAAAGSGTNDFWNSFYPTNAMGQLFDPSLLVPLFSADYTNAGAGMLMVNTALSGTNATGDPMFDSWLAASGTNLYVTLTNLPYGSYDIYVYGHGDSNELNSPVNVLAAWSDYGTTNTTTTGAWNTNTWIEGAQYVVFRDVLIPSGQNVQITVGTNSAGLAILNGFQLVGKTLSPMQDSDGDGLTDLDELQRGTNPYASDTDGDGVAVTNADSSRWSWGYDSLGQVTSGKRYWSDSTIVAGQQFEYAFDTIGNRTSASSGGSQFGTSLRTATYAANLLNQYTNRTVPGYIEVQGSANSNATVTVNNESTYRKGDYFRKELSANNTSAAVWLGITNVAVLNGAGTNGTDIVSTKTGNLLTPKTPEAFSYDADGNTGQDGRWNYSWDGENRLTRLEILTNAPDASRMRLDFAYDHQFRRVQKVVSAWSGSAYIAQSTNRFQYDGWNLVAILDSQSSLLCSFRWGTDLSGNLQGAGGVGGLLSMTVHQGTNGGTYFYCYDGNGNVAALVSAANGTVAARYEYGPFGELLRATGPLALLNPFRFSTKFCDDESGFCYYGYRFYDPSTGRWPSRDPIGELGGANLYGFVLNNPITKTDKFGLAVVDPDSSGNCPKMCCTKGGSAEQLVPIWICTRMLGGTGAGIPLINHQYICCSGANANCFGVQKYTPSCMATCKNNGFTDEQCEKQCYAKTGTPIEPEVSPTGTCEKRCVTANEKKTVCNGKQTMPENYVIGPNGIDCQEWADYSTSTSCKYKP